MITYVLMTVNQKWCCKPVIPALRRPRQDLYEFEGSLLYIESYKPASYRLRPCLKKITSSLRTNPFSLSHLLVCPKTKSESTVG